MQESFFLSFTWYTYAIMLPIIAFFGWLALPFALFASIIAFMLGTIYLVKEFTGPDFDWPPEFGVQARKHVISYIINFFYWFVEGEGEELATNTLFFFRLLKSNELDSSKGSHVFFMNGQIRRYGGEISEDDFFCLLEQHPGMFYAPVKEFFLILIRRSSAIDDVGRKEWQIHIRLRCKDDLSIQATMSNIEYDNITNCTYRTIIDTGSTTTTIPYYLRIKMSNGWYGWSTHSFLATGYGAGTKMNKVSRRWEICTGDGTNWSEWIETREINSWQKDIPEDLDCALIGYDVLNQIPIINL
ncbi:hypothetical protein F8M41_004148 [Gigaspora margarita]|nr:hypothetical protein F8M41_004148 [Gigaspora margarita]